MKYLPKTSILCLEKSEYVPKIASEDNFWNHSKRGIITVHGQGKDALIEFESIASGRIKAEIKAIYGDVYEYHSRQPLLKMVKEDLQARAFYAGYQLPDGRMLEIGDQLRYGRQCDWLNMIHCVLGDKKALKEELKITIAKFWEAVISLYLADDAKIPNGLPGTRRQLDDKLKVYKAEGYKGLITRRIGNQNSRKVSPKIERLLLSLYCQPHKPYMKEVCQMYEKFMSGEEKAVDIETGEVFNTQDYYVKGEPYKVAESTVDYYIKLPANQATVDKYRLSDKEYRDKHRPAVKRKPAYYAFSKISMDDVDIPFKTPDGKREVKSYLVFDVASKTCIGVAFGRDKTVELIHESLRDMARLCTRNGWGLPLEIEVEQHLNSTMKGRVNSEGAFEADLLTEGNIFPFVRFCRGENPQEKRAEGLIRQLKLGHLRRVAGFQGRPFARNEANRMNKDKDKARYAYDETVEMVMEMIWEYNNEPHPKQDIYPGLTKWQVLEQLQNPNTVKYPVQTIIPYIGFRTETSVKRGKLAVQYNTYQLPANETLEDLTSLKVEAYYIPDENGEIPTVYVYQKGAFICEAARQDGFQEARAEQTEADRANAEEQWGNQKAFDKMIKERKGALVSVGLVKAEGLVQNAEAETRGNVQENALNEGGYVQKLPATKVDWNDLESLEKQALSGI